MALCHPSLADQQPPSGTDAEKPVVSPALTSSKLSLPGADPPLTWHTLNSFIPIFELLGPKFVLDQNAYYIHGSVDDSDLAVLRDHRSMVTEFRLTNENIQPIITPSAFLHISRFLDPSSGLLPSLLRLRIVHADTYLAYLHLLYTPSLKTLEVANIPDHQHPNFFSFLTTLIHKSPFLEHMIFGPGQFPLKSLQAIPKFAHLRQLELMDVASTFDLTFIQDVGALPNLECFMLDARSCKYIASISEEQHKTLPTERTGAGSQNLKLSSDIDNNGLSGSVYFSSSPIYEEDVRSGIPETSLCSNYASVSREAENTISEPLSGYEDKEVCDSSEPNYVTIPGDISSSTSTAGGFYQLKKFHFVGGLPLIQDIIPCIASNTLEDISITVIRLLHQELEQISEEKDKNVNQAEAEERRRKAEEEKQRRILEVEDELSNYGYYYRHQREEEISKEAEDQWKDQEAQIEKRLREERIQWAQATFDLQTASYINVLQTVSSRWSEDLKSVKFNQLDRSLQPPSKPPALTKQVYETLFCHPKIEILEFKRWKLDSVEDFISSLKSSSPKNLKQLHLPIDDPDCCGVSLSSLLDIAKACPMLKSLQCCIDTLSVIPQYSTPTNKALSHGLQTLYVANDPTSLWDFNHLLLVARHLYFLFPRIQTIDNVDGPNAEKWVRISDLVKMFQIIREDDVYRFS